MTRPEHVCANWGPELPSCKKKGRLVCEKCQIVVYCSQACRTAHELSHNPDCESMTGLDTWKPSWVLEDRFPDFTDTECYIPLGPSKYLWGNTPALDFLNLGANEGERYDKPLKVLFAASGDLRNVIKTIGDLPSSYKHDLEVTINDRDFDLVARNVILLLIALVVEDPKEAIECMIHLWYSVLLRESDLDILHKHLRPLIEEACNESEGMQPKELIEKSWKFGNSLLRVSLDRQSWRRLLTYLTKPDGLTADRAREIRKASVLCHEGRYSRDLHLACLSQSRRFINLKFREDGLLLPFGSPQHEFKEPNPTFFQLKKNRKLIWPMEVTAEPLFGWSLQEILNTPSISAVDDIYGRLYFHLHRVLGSFLDRLEKSQISFRVLNYDAFSLPMLLRADYFSRIDVSNIADENWLGMRRTLQCTVPLLQSPRENPHATIITLLLNAVPMMMIEGEGETRPAGPKNTDPNFVRRFFSPLRKIFQQRGEKKTEPAALVLSQWVGPIPLPQEGDGEPFFERHMAKYDFARAEKMFGVEIREGHTVVEKWPWKLKLAPGEKGRDEVEWWIGGGVSGKERYVEWRKR